MDVALGPHALLERCANEAFRQNQKDEVVSSHISLPPVTSSRGCSER